MIRLVYSNYNEETGVSCVTLRTPLGEFTGYTKVHPEDIAFASPITGCRFAEIKALIKYRKAKVNVITNEIKGLTDFKNVLTGLTVIDDNDTSLKYLRRQIDIKREERQCLLNSIEQLRANMKESIALADKLHKKDKNN